MAKRSTDQYDQDEKYNQTDFDETDVNQKGGQSDTFDSDSDELDLDQ